MDLDLDLGGIFAKKNYSFDYDDYVYKDDCQPGSGAHLVAVFVPLLLSLTLVLGLLGNGLLLWVLAKRRRSWSVTDTFILHLGVADSLLLITLPLWAVQAAKGWSFGTPLCKISGALFTINFYCGIFLLACISLDRYLSIVKAGQMYSRRNPFWVQTICLSVWLLSLLLSVPDWIFLQAVEDERREKKECIQDYHLLSRSASDWRLASRLLFITVGFLLPSAVLLFCYSSILLRLQHSSQGLQKQRAVRIILALVLGFFLCWTPHNITLMVDSFKKKAEEPADGSCESTRTALESGLVVTAALACFHACLRPLLYLWLCVKFRKRVVELLRCAAGVEADAKLSLWGLSVGEKEEGSSATDRAQEKVVLDRLTAVEEEQELSNGKGKSHCDLL